MRVWEIQRQIEIRFGTLRKCAEHINTNPPELTANIRGNRNNVVMKAALCAALDLPSAQIFDKVWEADVEQLKMEGAGDNSTVSSRD